MEDNTAVTAYFSCINDNYNNLKQICKDVCVRNKEKYSEDTVNVTLPVGARSYNEYNLKNENTNSLPASLLRTVS